MTNCEWCGGTLLCVECTPSKPTPDLTEALARLKALEERIEARAAKIRAAHDAPDSYYRVAGDEPVDYVLDDELKPWADEIAAILKKLGASESEPSR